MKNIPKTMHAVLLTGHGDLYSSGLVHTISFLSLDNEFAQIINYKDLTKKI